MSTTVLKRIESCCEFLSIKTSEVQANLIPAHIQLLIYRNGAQKLLGVLITIGEAVAYVVSGMYGDVRELGAWSAILIITQVYSLAAAFVTAVRLRLQVS